MSVRRWLFSFFMTLLSCMCFITAWAQDTGQARANRVLSLDGDYVEMAGDARFVEAELPGPGELIIPSILTGMVVGKSGGPIPNASVRLERNETDASGTKYTAP